MENWNALLADIKGDDTYNIATWLDTIGYDNQALFGINVAPIVEAASYEITNAETLVINVSDLLNNGTISDPNGNDDLDWIDYGTWSSTAGTIVIDRNGTYNDITDDVITYTPADGYIGDDNFALYAYDDASLWTYNTITVTVTDSALAPSYELTASADSVDEGSSVTITLDTANVDAGTELTYTITGVNADDIDGDLTGTVTVGDDGTATFTVDVASDDILDETDTLTVTLDADTEATVDIVVNDTSTDDTGYTVIEIDAATAVDGSAGGVDGVAEIFVYEIDSSTGDVLSLETADLTINYTPGEDILRFDDVSTGTVTDLTFAGEVELSQSSINDLTDIVFDADANGDGYTLTLIGVVDETLGSVDLQVV